MDIPRFIDAINLGFLTLLFGTVLLDLGDSTSIFDVTLAEQPSQCSSFTIPKKQSIIDPSVIHPPAISEKLNYEYSITTPNFPNNYPTDIQCITLIKAPNADYIIVLEVRRMFDIEPSKNCVRDFLEITDGPYGFSRKIGRFCNSEMPPKDVRSTGPFLWLRFRSDNSLSHNGFTIVFRFIRNTRVDPNINYCYSQVKINHDEQFKVNTSFLLAELYNSVKFQNNASIPLECVYDFYVSPGFRTFVYKSIFKKPNFPLPCSSNSLAIYHKGTYDEDVHWPRKQNFFPICEETDFIQHLFVRSTRTTFRILISDLSKINTMSFILTSVKIKTEKCPLDNFLCSKSPEFCISKKLLCNGEVNCPEMADENCIGVNILKPGEEKNTTTTTDPIIGKKAKQKLEEEEILRKTNKNHAIILGSIGSVLVISMVFCLVLTIHSKKKDKETARINIVNVPESNQNKPQNNKNLFYELLQSSEPSVAALSTEKLSRKVYNDNLIWSKRPPNESFNSSAHRINDSSYKLNGGIKGDSMIRTATINPFKPKVDATKGSSLHRIGKYLSVPYPVKNETTVKPVIPKRLTNQIQPFNIASPSEDFQSWSSHSFSKQNSSTNRSIHHIQRASSMGSGLRRQLQESVEDDDLSKNVEWYCGPVIRSGNNQNSSSEMLNAHSAKSSQHVPGCRSLPNFSNVELQNPVYYTKPIPSSAHLTEADSFDCSADDNSSYREDTPSFSVQNHYQKQNSHKYADVNRQNSGATSSYGFKYFCAHEPTSSNDFVEYIA